MKIDKRTSAPRFHRQGFTLIELLVVISIIALLLSIIVPALRVAKLKASSIVCMTNSKNLSLGWFMYQQDNNGKIMSAQMEDVGTQRPAQLGWIGQPHHRLDRNASRYSMFQTNPPISEEDRIRGIKQGKLYPYINESKVYNCPADRHRLGPDGNRLYTSYVVSAALYGTTDKADPLYNRQIRRFSEMRSPSRSYVFVESGEKERGNWNAYGWFVMATPAYGHSGYGWWSPIAINHGKSSVFGFGDGHTEVRIWRDQDTFDHYKVTESGSSSYNIRIPDGDMGEDLRFLVSGWAYR